MWIPGGIEPLPRSVRHLRRRRVPPEPVDVEGGHDPHTRRTTRDHVLREAVRPRRVRKLVDTRAQRSLHLPCALGVRRDGELGLVCRVADRGQLSIREDRPRFGVERDLDRGGAERGEFLDGRGGLLGPRDLTSGAGRPPGGSHRVAARHRQHRARCADQRTVERRELGQVGQWEDAVRRPPKVADRGHAAGEDRGGIREPDVHVPIGRRRHHDAVGGHHVGVLRDRMHPADGRDHAAVQIDLDVGR